MPPFDIIILYTLKKIKIKVTKITIKFIDFLIIIFLKRIKIKPNTDKNLMYSANNLKNILK